MVTTRVASLAQSQLITNAALRTKNSISDLQIQVATGKKTQRFSGIPDDASRLVTLKSELTKTEQFLQNITVTEKRLDLMEFALDQVEQIARTARTDFSNSLNGSTADDRDLPTLAQAALDQVIQILNTRDDSRYLFAGGKVTTEPVDISGVTLDTSGPPDPTFDQTADFGYYNGDSVDQTTRVDDGFNVAYGVRANETAFEKVLRSLNNVASITFSDPITEDQKEFLRDAVTELSEAIDDNGTDQTIGGLHAGVGLDKVILNNFRSKHEDFLKFVQDSIGQIENVDTAEAVASLNFEQIQLEASFTTIARIQTLSLSNFLR